MRLYLLQSIKQILIVGFSLSLAVNVCAGATDCEVIQEAIKKGDSSKLSAASSCARAIGASKQTDLVKLALEYRQGEIASALLRSSERSIIGPGLIHKAALFEQPHVVRYILAQNPELLEVKDASGRTPLTSAAVGRAYMVASVLLDNGANEEVGQSMIVAIGRSREIAYLIAQKNRDWLSDNSITGDILSAAIQYTDEAFLQYLLELGVRPNILDSTGYLALLHAPQHGDVLVGERNWGFMVGHGAMEQQAICSIPSSKIAHIEANAPEWYATKVSEIRPTCSRM